MNSFVLIAFAACIAAVNAGYYGKILQGPSSKTTLVGPDGSVISAIAPGGSILHEEHPGYVAHHAPVVAPVAYAAPVPIGHETHISKYGTHINHGAPAVVATYAAPLGYAGWGHGGHNLVAAPYPYHSHGLYNGHHGLYGGHHGLYF